jgi:hypothetical protein
MLYTINLLLIDFPLFPPPALSKITNGSVKTTLKVSDTFLHLFELNNKL